MMRHKVEGPYKVEKQLNDTMSFVLLIASARYVYDINMLKAFVQFAGSSEG